jgi:hypothetical protein
MFLAVFITPLSPLEIRGEFRKNGLVSPSYPDVVGPSLEPRNQPLMLSKELICLKGGTNHMNEHNLLTKLCQV